MRSMFGLLIVAALVMAASDANAQCGSSYSSGWYSSGWYGGYGDCGSSSTYYGRPYSQPQPRRTRQADPQPQLETPKEDLTSYNIEFDEPVRTIEWIRIKGTNGRFTRGPVLNGFLPQPVAGGFKYDLKIVFSPEARRRYKEVGYIAYVARTEKIVRHWRTLAADQVARSGE